MGEYEPEDSRNVTLKQGHEPGGLKRTGPREDQARAEAQEREGEKKEKKKGDKGEPMPGQQQRQRQSQSQSQSQGRSQTQDQNQRGKVHPPQPHGSSLAGNQKQAIDNEVGSARPEYDQYELNQPANLARYGVRRPDSEDDESGERQDQPQADPRQGEQAAAQSEAQAGYGNSRTEEGAVERDEIKAVESKDAGRETGDGKAADASGEAALGAPDPDMARADADREL